MDDVTLVVHQVWIPAGFLHHGQGTSDNQVVKWYFWLSFLTRITKLCGACTQSLIWSIGFQRADTVRLFDALLAKNPLGTKTLTVVMIPQSADLDDVKSSLMVDCAARGGKYFAEPLSTLKVPVILFASVGDTHC